MWTPHNLLPGRIQIRLSERSLRQSVLTSEPEKTRSCNRETVRWTRTSLKPISPKHFHLKTIPERMKSARYCDDL